ncbi:hypothetical protein B0H16DRAFT_1481594 [Mycena metata]|uniref:Uncharacterized protein n=1 Tax=Mycena metata TaxID=1033252 RepID=A0AAD7GXD6_9AGAR|nr:hypothetical protein B0H16DRAFT_1481594 [Mycena metata]
MVISDHLLSLSRTHVGFAFRRVRVIEDVGALSASPSKLERQYCEKFEEIFSPLPRTDHRCWIAGSIFPGFGFPLQSTTSSFYLSLTPPNTHATQIAKYTRPDNSLPASSQVSVLKTPPPDSRSHSKRASSLFCMDVLGDGILPCLHLPVIWRKSRLIAQYWYPGPFSPRRFSFLCTAFSISPHAAISEQHHRKPAEGFHHEKNWTERVCYIAGASTAAESVLPRPLAPGVHVLIAPGKMPGQDTVSSLETQRTNGKG